MSPDKCIQRKIARGERTRRLLEVEHSARLYLNSAQSEKGIVKIKGRIASVTAQRRLPTHTGLSHIFRKAVIHAREPEHDCGSGTIESSTAVCFSGKHETKTTAESPMLLLYMRESLDAALSNTWDNSLCAIGIW